MAEEKVEKTSTDDKAEKESAPIDEDVPLEQLTDEEKKLRSELISQLKKFLYTGSEVSSFIAGIPERNFKAQLQCLEKFKNTRFKRTPLCVMEEATNSGIDLPQRETVFYALATLLKYDDLSNTYRNDIYQAARRLMKNDQELFRFIKYTSNKPNGRKVPSGLQKLIRQYYLNKEPKKLAEDISRNNGFYGWTHKDVLKLAHCKTDNEVVKMIFHYILFGIEKSKELDVLAANEEAKDIFDLFKSVKSFRSSNEENYITENMGKLNFSFSQIPPQMNKSKSIWEVLVPNMTFQEVVKFLPRMHKNGLLRQDSAIQKKVLEIFSDSEKVKASKIHPVELLIGLRNYEKGGKPKDVHKINHLKQQEEKKKESDANYVKKEIHASEAIKGTILGSALYKTFMMSLKNIHSTNKSMYIAIEASKRMELNPCLTTKTVSCMEAASILAWTFFKTEKNCTILCSQNKALVPVTLEKGISFNSFVKKLQEVSDEEHLNPSTVIQYAAKEKHAVDVFINLTCQVDQAKIKERPMEHLKKYNQQLSKHAKLINCFFGIHTNPYVNIKGNETYSAGLGINGFDKNVPKVIEAYIKGGF